MSLELPPIHPPATILVVEDDPVSAQVLTALCSRLGCRPLTAPDGGTALELAARHRPDLILLDIVMEGMDGFQVCRRLKADDQLRSIPVIFISALREEEEEALGLGLGAVDYIFKPFRAAIVTARIRTHLELKRHRDHLAELVAERTRELEAAASRIKVLKGLLPICAACKKIRDDSGTWQPLESYIERRSHAEFSHGICPQCARRLHPEIYEDTED